MSEIVSDKSTFNYPICNKCKNKLDGIRCFAFNTIPDIILTGKNNHSIPLPEQTNDVIFEEK